MKKLGTLTALVILQYSGLALAFGGGNFPIEDDTLVVCASINHRLGDDVAGYNIEKNRVSKVRNPGDYYVHLAQVYTSGGQFSCDGSRNTFSLSKQFSDGTHISMSQGEDGQLVYSTDAVDWMPTHGEMWWPSELRFTCQVSPNCRH